MHLTARMDLGEFRDSWKRTQLQIRRLTLETVDTAGMAAVQYAKANAAFKDHTGALRSTIYYTKARWTGTEAWCWFISQQQYSSFVEDGTRAHEIWPKEGHGFIGPLRPSQGRRELTDIGTHRVALRWYVGGKPVFARMVHHPKTDPLPYMHPAAEFTESWMLTTLERQFAGLQTIWN